MSKRQYHLVEEKYLAEYIAKTFPKAVKVFYQVPMTDKPWRLAAKRRDIDAKWFYRFGARCDAVVITPEALHIIEAETRRPIIGLSELEVYAENYKYVPALKPWVDLPLKVQLVTPIMDEHVAAIMRSRGWDYVIFHPPWIDEHLKRWGIIE